jgi:hypothetical protein
MASPLFTIDGGAVGVKASVVAGATVTFSLDSISGVQSTAWEVLTTDDTTVTTDYTPNPAGSVNQTMTLTALTAGTAAIVKCTINGGIDHETGQASDEMWTTAKFYVETLSGKEVLCAGELDDDSREASATHGAVEPINDDIRTPGGTVVTYTALAGAGPTTHTLLAIPTDDRVYFLRVTATAKGQTSTDAAAYQYLYCVKRVAGTAVQLAAPLSVKVDEDDATWGITIAVASTNVNATIAHDAAEDVKWEIETVVESSV